MSGKEKRYIDFTKTANLKWCPNCGHYHVMKNLQKALRKTDWKLNEVVVVTDIGCVGLADRNCLTNAFHGLHGRSVTYATGLKLANPDLKVIVLMGDGGCGIGGTHIVNAARRNIGIKVLVCNNFNYGMTGCQQSVTTPLGGKTKTSSMGCIEVPLDVCKLALAGEASWVGRMIITQDNMTDFVELLYGALMHDGFSLLDIIERCPGGYGKNNDLSGEEEFKKYVLKLNYKTGLIYSEERAEFANLYRERLFRQNSQSDRNKENGGLPPTFTSNLNRKVGIIVAGSAGQSIQTATTIFGGGAILSGLYATQRNYYPITKQSGYSIAETIISPDRIEYTGISRPDILLILSKDGLEAMEDIVQEMNPGSKIITTINLLAEIEEIVPSTNATIGIIPAALHSGKEKISVKKEEIPLVALVSLFDISTSYPYPVEAFKKSATLLSPKDYKDSNREAIEHALRYMKTKDSTG